MDFMNWALSSVGTATLLAIAAFLGRSQLSHWLNKDLEVSKSRLQREIESQRAAYQLEIESHRAAFQRDLESQKSALQRELEVYKVTLIAETERLKASQDVQKAMAIRLGEKKFEAFDKLHRSLEVNAVSSIYAAHLVHLNSEQQARTELMEQLLNLQDQMTEAISLASPFLTLDEKAILLGYASKITDFICKLGKAAPRYNKASLDLERDRLQKFGFEAENIVHTYLTKMLAMA